MTRFFAVAVAMCACGMAAGRLSRAQDEARVSSLSAELKEAIVRMERELRRFGPLNKKITIGKFTHKNDGTPPSAGGVAIERALGEQLKARGYQVTPDAPWIISGEFSGYRDPKTSSQPSLHEVGVLIAFQVRDRLDNQVVAEFNRGVLRDIEVSALLGATGDLPAGTTRAQRLANLESAVENPRYDIQDGVVYSSDRRQYGIQLLVRQGAEYLPIDATVADNAAFSKVGLNQTYAIRLHNGTGRPVAVRVFIDGLDMFSFADTETGRDPDGNPKYSHLVVEGNTADITGWYFNDQHVNEFLVAKYSPNAPPYLRAPDKIGMITVQFHSAWKGDNLPDGETGDLAPGYTDLGARVRRETIRSDYRVGPMRSTITLHYSK